MRSVDKTVRGLRSLGSLAVLALALFVGPYVIPWLGGYTDLLTEMLIWALFAMGFNLLLGYTGILSFGHAAFFGLGGYTMAFMLIRFDWPLPAAMLAGVALAGSVALLIAVMIVRKAGIYFAMLTIAFGQMCYFIALDWTSVTGGENGLTGIPRDVFGIPQLPAVEVDISTPLSFYYFTAVFFFLSVVLLRRLVGSNYVRTLQAIRENTMRAESVGYNVKLYKITAFVISALYASVAGCLYALFLNYMFPQTLYWVTSGDVVLMTLVGGMRSFWGPALGAAIIVYLRNLISFYTEYWNLYIGIIFVAFVIFFPEGILGLRVRREGILPAYFRKTFKRRASTGAGE